MAFGSLLGPAPTSGGLMGASSWQTDPELMARLQQAMNTQGRPMGALEQLRAAFADPEKRAALLGFGQNMLAASGWSDRPVTIGQAVASGMQGATDAMEARRKAAAEDALLQLKQRQIDQEASGTAPWTTDLGRQVGLYASQLKSQDPNLTDEQAQYMALENINARQLDLIGARTEAQARLEGVRDYYARLREGRKPDVEAATAAAVGKAEGATAAQVESEKRARGAQDILGVLDEAEALIPQSTGSYAGAGRDMLGRAVGVSTEGAQAIAQLKVLGQKVLEKIPRMEGPQSDADRKMYQEAAGQLGDPTIPADERMAALRTIRALQQRYAGSQQARPPMRGAAPAAPVAPAASPIDSLLEKYR